MKHRSKKFKKPVVIGSFMTAIAVVLGGVSSLAVAASPNEVTVSIDGATRHVSTEANTVKGLFKQLNLAVSSHDQVTPALDQPVPHRGTVQLLRAKPVVEAVDGRPKVVWKVSTPSKLKELPVYLDGKLQQQVVDLSASPRSTLQARGIKLSALDRVVVGEHDGKQAILVSRVSRSVTTDKEEVAPKVEKTEDKTLKPGEEVVDQPGEAGQVAKTSFTETIDGQVVFTSQPVTLTLREAKPKKVRVGAAKANPNADATATPGYVTPSGEAQQIAHDKVIARGWGEGEFACLVNLWNRESGWNTHAGNPARAYGIPQALPGNKMAAAGPDWMNNPETQINWGLGYITGRYGTPCNAWAHFRSHNWY